MASSDDLSRRELIEAAAATALVAPSVLAAQSATTVAQYVLTRLRQLGVDALFGVPGATCDPLFAAAEAMSFNVVVTSSDLEAGYAADGYARVRGLGAVSVTYGVGMLSLAAAISGAYAERSPVVVINGGPSADDLRIQKELGTTFSHSNGRAATDLNVFRELTEVAIRVERAGDAPKQIDSAITAAITAKRPVYIEIAKHLWDAACPAPSGALDGSVAPSGEEDKIAL